MASDSVITQIGWVKKCLDDMYPKVIESEEDFVHLLTAVMHFCEYQGYNWDACHREAHDIFLREREKKVVKLASFMEKLERLAMEADDIADHAKMGYIEKSKMSSREVLFHVTCATRDISQMAISVAAALDAIAAREKVDKLST